MTRDRHLPFALLSLSLASPGCGDDPQLDQADGVRFWATSASAVAVYSHAYEPIAFADGESTFTDPECPATEDDGTTVTITGGCTDAQGSQWRGLATIVRSAEGDRSLTLDGYAKGDPSDVAAASGTVELRRTGDTTHEFEADLVLEGGSTTTIDYAGDVEGGYDGATVWNGSGSVSRDGMVEPTGTVSATTEDERVDDSVCSGQPVSGRTTFDDGEITAVVTYDGETDCDSEQRAGWSVDGRDRGTLTGIYCTAATPGAGRHAAPWAFAIALTAIAVRRHRR